MARTGFPIALLLTVITLAPSCSKKTPTGTEERFCPDPAGTVSAKVDGVSWASNIAGAIYGGTFLLIEGEIQDNSGNVLSDLSILLPDVQGPGTYSLTPGPQNWPTGDFCDSRMPGGTVDADGDCYSPHFSTDPVATGTITIDAFSTSTKRLSGAFSFSALNLDDSSTVRITEGRFGMRYCEGSPVGPTGTSRATAPGIVRGARFHGRPLP